MAINFDVTVGGVDTTSYVTVAEYTAYTEKLLITTGLPANDATSVIQRLLIAATEAVNSLLYSASGDPTASTQKLEYPRTGITNRRGNAIASDIIPQSLKDAVVEMAMYMYLNDMNNVAHDSWEDDVESGSISSSVSYDFNMKPKPSEIVPRRVKQLIANITGTYPSNSMTAVRG